MADKKQPPPPTPKAHEVPASTFDFDKPPDETGTAGDDSARPPGFSESPSDKLDAASILPMPEFVLEKLDRERAAATTLRAFCTERGLNPAVLLPYVGGGDIDRLVELEQLEAAVQSTKERV